MGLWEKCLWISMAKELFSVEIITSSSLGFTSSRNNRTRTPLMRFLLEEKITYSMSLLANRGGTLLRSSSVVWQTLQISRACKKRCVSTHLSHSLPRTHRRWRCCIWAPMPTAQWPTTNGKWLPTPLNLICHSSDVHQSNVGPKKDFLKISIYVMYDAKSLVWCEESEHSLRLQFKKKINVTEL